jgi:phospholipid-translocating ATPase
MAPSTLGPNGLLKSIATLNVASLFSGKRPNSLPRTVFVNHPKLPPEHLDSRGQPAHVYTPNQMITSKYNFITFIPRNLLEQFRRVANLYVKWANGRAQ